MKYQKQPNNNLKYMTNANVYTDRVRSWEDGEYTVYRDHQYTAPGCHNACGMLFYVKDGKVEKVEGDYANSFNQGKTCARCANLPEIMYHEKRLKYPMVRDKADRGKDKWKRVTWEEAYEKIRQELEVIWEEDGHKAVALLNGTGRNTCTQSAAFAYGGLRTPNMSLGFLSGSCCWVPRMFSFTQNTGSRTILDASQGHPDRYESPLYEVPDVIIIWAKNPLCCNNDGNIGHWITDLMKQGSRLIVIDPALTWLATRADIWLRVRPGTDAALALAMANVIIEEGLYDHEFVENWSFGWEEFVERAKEYPVDEVAEICWCEPEKIVQAARMYATAPRAALDWGLPIDQCKNAVPTGHALNALRAMTGNIDAPGGDMCMRHTFGLDSVMNSMIESVPVEELEGYRLGAQMSPFTVGHQGATAQPDAILRAMEIGEPYKVRAACFWANNNIANMAAEAPRVLKVLQGLDFSFAVDYYMTPTIMAVCDVVLPVAMSAERNTIGHNFMPLKAHKKFVEYYEAKGDDQIIVELGAYLGGEGFKDMKEDKDFINAYLRQFRDPSPDDLDYDTLCEENCGLHYDDYGEQYYKYRSGLLRADGQPGFNTTTGRYEFLVTAYARWGKVDPLPFYEEPPESPYSTPELWEEYPLIFTAGHRSYEYFHSEGRNQKTLREIHPWPRCELSPATAEKYGLEDGDWVWIENQRGRCKQMLKICPGLDDRQCRAEHGWWYPENEGEAPNLFNVFDSNPNNLIPQFQYGPTAYGAPYKTQLCKVYKVTPENDCNLTESYLAGNEKKYEYGYGDPADFKSEFSYKMDLKTFGGATIHDGSEAEEFLKEER